MKKAQPGFTLIEMLVSITIFSGIVILALGAFAMSISSSAKVSATRERTEAARSVVDQISTDLRYAYNQPVNIVDSKNNVLYIVSNGYGDSHANTDTLEVILKYPTSDQLVHRLYRIYHDTSVHPARWTIKLTESRTDCSNTSGSWACSDLYDSAQTASDLLSANYALDPAQGNDQPITVVADTFVAGALTARGTVTLNFTLKPSDMGETLCSAETVVGGKCYTLKTTIIPGGY